MALAWRWRGSKRVTKGLWSCSTPCSQLVPPTKKKSRLPRLCSTAADIRRFER